MSKRLFRFLLVLAGVALNLVLQSLLIAAGPKPRILIPGVADFEPAWNRGVSFSLFIQNGSTGGMLLIGVLAIISIGVAAMMWRSANYWAATGYALVLVGALGNLIDRLRFEGAVFDFLALHLGPLPLFVCNLPDIFISAGAVLLIVETLPPKPQSTSAPFPR